MDNAPAEWFGLSLAGGMGTCWNYFAQYLAEIIAVKQGWCMDITDSQHTALQSYLTIGGKCT